jgi:hypothetical protein
LPKVSVLKRVPKVDKNINRQDMEIIIVPQGVSKYLGDTFKRSQPFIRKVLRGDTNHRDAGKIREFALRNGGAMVKSS